MIIGYQIRKKRLTDTDWEAPIDVGNVLTYTYTDLVDGVTYQFQIRGYDEDTIYGEWSDIITATTSESLVPDAPPSPDTPVYLLQTGYNNISPEMIRAINRGEIYYFGVEFYRADTDEIFLEPENAIFRFATARFKWRGLSYRDNIKSMPELAKFIGKTFNNFSIEIANVTRNSRSGSAFVLNNLIRGYRVAVRLIFPDLEGLEHTRHIWWGRVATVEDVNETSVKVNCSQEIGNFSYEIAPQKFGQACPLWFGRGECLGNETLGEKSPLFQAAYNQFGQGGCNRTYQRCKQLSNDEFYQGQNATTVTGQFIRTEIVKKKILWIFTITKKNRIPVQWSSKNQSENSDVTIPIVVGRAKVQLHAFTWADIGEKIIALLGGSKGQIEGFYNITCENPELTIESVTQHYGELGGEGNQQPDPRFPQTGFNSKLAYVGITYAGSPPEDEPEETPDTSAVIKGLIIETPVLRARPPVVTTIPLPPVPPPPPTPNPPLPPTTPIPPVPPNPEPPAPNPNPGPGPQPVPCPQTLAEIDSLLDVPAPCADLTEYASNINIKKDVDIRFSLDDDVEFFNDWSNSPVWITRMFLLNFPYTVVKRQWFNEHKNYETAQYCSTVVEDDTDAEIPVVTSSEFQRYAEGAWKRFRSTNRVDATSFSAVPQSRAQNELYNVPMPIDGEVQPDIWWNSPVDNPIVGQSRTYLAQRYTANGVINDTAKLSDILFSLLLPTFRGFIRFNHFGKIEIDCRKPAKHTYLRADTPLASTVIPVASVVNIFEGGRQGGLYGAVASTVNSRAHNELYQKGYLLIGVGSPNAEIARIIGTSYVNGSALTVVTATTSGTLDLTVSPAFIEREGGPSEIFMDFSGVPTAGEKIELTFTEPDGTILKWDYFVDTAADSLDLIVQMFKTRLMASPSFRETWTAETFSGLPFRIIIRCQTGYLELDRPLVNTHEMGDEVLKVVEVYEDGRDGVHSNGIKDNLRNFTLNVNKQDTYHGVKSTYISAVQDFRETEIQPRVAWDAAEEERNLNLMELDLRFCDNYRQAAFLTKSAAIEFVDGNLWATWGTGIRGMLHEEGDVVAIRHQTMQGISYTPFTIEELKFNESNQETMLTGKIYFSAAFDERVAKEEKFLETSLTPNPSLQVTPPPILTAGGYSTVKTGDGNGNGQDVKYESKAYQTFPQIQKYSPEGRDKL